ncbi:response regulator [Dimargaris xerosporica]|nr:response regulator [Dimargaris xerosporica]
MLWLACQLCQGILVVSLGLASLTVLQSPSFINLAVAFWWAYGYHQFRTHTKAMLSLPVLDHLAESAIGPFLVDLERSWQFPTPTSSSSGAVLTSTGDVGTAVVTALVVAVITLVATVTSAMVYAAWIILQPLATLFLAWMPAPLGLAPRWLSWVVFGMARALLPGFVLASTPSGLPLVHWRLTWLHLAPLLSLLLLTALYAMLWFHLAEMQKQQTAPIADPVLISPSPALPRVSVPQTPSAEAQTLDQLMATVAYNGLLRSSDTLYNMQTQLTPYTLLSINSRSELLAPTSIPLPYAAFSAINSFLRQINYLADYMTLESCFRSIDSPASGQTGRHATLTHWWDHQFTTFDLVDLVQCIGDFHAGVAAEHRVTIVLSHALRIYAYLPTSPPAATVASDASESTGLTDSPFQDLMVSVRAPYDFWYHIISAVTWAATTLTTPPLLLEFGFFLTRTVVDPACDPVPAGTEATDPPMRTCVFRWALRFAAPDPSNELQQALVRQLTITDRLLRRLNFQPCRVQWVQAPDDLAVDPLASPPEMPQIPVLLVSLTLPYYPSSTKSTQDVVPIKSSLRDRAKAPSPSEFHRSTSAHSDAIMASSSSKSPLVPASEPEGLPTPSGGLSRPNAEAASNPSSKATAVAPQADYFANSTAAARAMASLNPLGITPSLPQPPLMAPGPSDETFSEFEITAAQVTEFTAQLKQLSIVLYHQPRSAFAEKIMAFLAKRIGANVTRYVVQTKHLARVKPLYRMVSSGLPAPAPTPSQPPTFVIIDDDPAVLRDQFLTLRNTLSPDAVHAQRETKDTSSMPDSPAAAVATTDPSSGRLVSAVSHGSHRQPPISSPSSHRSEVLNAIRATTLICFTSIGYYKKTKSLLRQLIAEPHGLPAPDVSIIPKPAGTKRIIAALYSALHKPRLNSTVLPNATTPAMVKYPYRIPIAPDRHVALGPTAGDIFLSPHFQQPPALGPHVGPADAAQSTVAIRSTHANDLLNPTEPALPIGLDAKQPIVTTTPQNPSAPSPVDNEPPTAATIDPFASPDLAVAPGVALTAVPKDMLSLLPLPSVEPDESPNIVVTTAAAQPILVPSQPALSTSLPLESSATNGPGVSSVDANLASALPTSGTLASATPAISESKPVAKPTTKVSAKGSSWLKQIRQSARRKKDSTTSVPKAVPTDAGHSREPEPTWSPAPDHSGRTHLEGDSLLDGDDLLERQPSGAPPILTSQASHADHDLGPGRFGRSPAEAALSRHSRLTRTSSLSPSKSPFTLSIPPIKVLIVEDNLVDRRIINRFMTNHGVKHELASTGKEAIEKWNQDHFHLVFMDLQLPDMSGIEITREIRRLEDQRIHGPAHLGGFTMTNSTTPVTASLTDPLPDQPVMQPLGPCPMVESLDSQIYPNGGRATVQPASLSATQSPDLSTPTMGVSNAHGSPAIIVALTASNLDTDRLAAYGAGCNDFLIKPIDTHWMKQKLLEWGAMHALIDFEGFKTWKVADARRLEYKANKHSECKVSS